MKYTNKEFRILKRSSHFGFIPNETIIYNSYRKDFGYLFGTGYDSAVLLLTRQIDNLIKDGTIEII
jgi:hypothetical protein